MTRLDEFEAFGAPGQSCQRWSELQGDHEAQFSARPVQKLSLVDALPIVKGPACEQEIALSRFTNLIVTTLFNKEQFVLKIKSDGLSDPTLAVWLKCSLSRILAESNMWAHWLSSDRRSR